MLLAFGRLGGTGVEMCPMLIDSGSTSVSLVSILGGFGRSGDTTQVWPILGRLWPTSPELGRILVDAAQLLSRSAQTWPIPSHVWPMFFELGPDSVELTRPNLTPLGPTQLADLLIRPGFGQIWPARGRLRGPVSAGQPAQSAPEADLRSNPGMIAESTRVKRMLAEK